MTALTLKTVAMTLRAALLALTIAAPSAAAQKSEGSVDSRLRSLEESVELLMGMGAPEASPPAAPSPAVQPQNGLKLALIVDTAAAWFHGEPMQLGAHDPNSNGFHLQQVELSLTQSVDHRFELVANIVFSPFGVEVEEAFGRTTALPGRTQLKMGQFLTRMGRLNGTHPHAWSFVDQPLVHGVFLGAEGSRGAGLEASWLTPLPWYAELFASATNASGECCARSFLGGSNWVPQSAAHLLYTLGLKQFFALSEATGLAWGLSAQLGPNATGNGNRTELYGSDLYLRWRRPGASSRRAVSLTVEGMLRRRQVPGDLMEDGGGYGQLVWTINPRWAVGLRQGLVLGAPDRFDGLAGSRQRSSAQATYRPSHFSRLRLQCSRGQAAAASAPVWAAMLGAEFLVGAHGAHKY